MNNNGNEDKGVCAFSFTERRELAKALLARQDTPGDGLSAFRALFPEAKQDLLDLVADLNELAQSEDWQGIAAIAEELKEIVEGDRTPPDTP